MNTALITGATSGIGLELAKIMAKHGHNLVLASRDKNSLESLATELKTTGSIQVNIVPIDLSVPGSALELYTKSKQYNINILVNNAGAGYVADFFDGDLKTHQNIAHLNMVSLMELCYYFGKEFRDNNAGRILNIASIVAFFPGPAQPVYYASKAFVRSLTRTLAYNLRNTNVTVTALHPGATRTKFFKTAQAEFHKKAADPAQVAQLGYDSMMAGKIEVTHGLMNKFLTNIFARFVPYRFQAGIVDRASDV